MALEEIFAAVKEQLGGVLSGLGKPVPTMGLGKAEIHKSSAPPRIVMIPVAGPTARTDTRGGEPRALWKRQLHVEFHVWERDIGPVEALANHLVAAMQVVMPGSYSIVGESWDTEGVTQAGLVMVLTAQLLIPWTDETPVKAVVTTAPITGVVVHPGA